MEEQLVMENKFYNKKKVVVLLFFFSTMFSCLINISSIVKNQTKSILNINNIHLTDTLGIISPISVVYLTVDQNNFDVSIKSNNYKVFDSTIVPKHYKPFPEGASQVNNYVKVQLKKYLTCFQHIMDVSVSPDDSLLIKRQVSAIEQTLKYHSVQHLPIPDSLYRCFKKYGYKQYLVTDAMEYYYAEVMDYNIHSYYRFFIFDLASKSLSFYDFHLDGNTISPRGKINKNYYTSGRWSYLDYIKSYNQKIEQAYKNSLEQKK